MHVANFDDRSVIATYRAKEGISFSFTAMLTHGPLSRLSRIQAATWSNFETFRCLAKPSMSSVTSMLVSGSRFFQPYILRAKAWSSRCRSTALPSLSGSCAGGLSDLNRTAPDRNERASAFPLFANGQSALHAPEQSPLSSFAMPVAIATPHPLVSPACVGVITRSADRAAIRPMMIRRCFTANDPDFIVPDE